jgi:hypothetical protein
MCPAITRSYGRSSPVPSSLPPDAKADQDEDDGDEKADPATSAVPVAERDG